MDRVSCRDTLLLSRDRHVMHLLWTLLAISYVVTGTYVTEKKFDHYHNVNSASSSRHNRKYGPPFSTDKDVIRFLRLFGKDAMIWRCKNAIQPYWNWKPLPAVELYCEAIGSLKAVNWYHNGRKIKLGVRYRQAIYPHQYHGNYFSTWIDFRLRIYNATHRDSGIFTFEVIGKKGSRNLKNVYVDISEKRRKRKGKLWRLALKRHRQSPAAKHSQSS